MRSANHQSIRYFGLTRQLCKDTVEDTHPVPAHKAVIQRLMRPVLLGFILSLQAILDDINGPNDHAQIIPTCSAVGIARNKLYAFLPKVHKKIADSIY
jgi:hypothetical protein